MGAIRAHHTATSSKRWSGPAAEARLPNDAPARAMRGAYAWVSPDADGGTKAAYKFIHHEVARNGDVGAASERACSSGIAVLNGGRGGTDIPAGDRKGVYRHLATHLKDAGREPPELR